ncbi:hypothetical protein ABFS82_06G106300 [Erythranthe guttata]|uniref:Uncharacterized protein n=1 Tax=Erythranthe guttata TaxID=4155 RepID=A0A022PZD8_ERYGU|nr:PREDICTED: protein REVEILLE 6-like isoform X1 [Erythranthe guttata]EYU19585.1 hypothetical protein MIMGU_mgv1a011457mg [Erythranthe guttata]|eukprot:XP_012858788.1 PREDICTED: protein REVEILLE 6-like isoform X1 [Erythranthe guttata]
MALSNTVDTTSFLEDPNTKIRKPYTITKSRESWTEPEHDKFLEALQLFDRDWKKIEAFVGSKTVIQIRSHAQKYFMKAQKSGNNEHLPPPRPKRKAAHPYPQKASKIAPVVPQAILSFQVSPTGIPDPGFVRRPDSSSLQAHRDIAVWTDNSVHTNNNSHDIRGDIRSAGLSVPVINSCSIDDSTQRTMSTALPDFAQVYSFIGSVFDPNVSDHLQKLKNMDPIDIETVLLLVRNLSINLASPDFEDHKKLLSSNELDPEKHNACVDTDPTCGGQFKDDAS